MAHRSPSTIGWELATRSMSVWKDMLNQDPALQAAIEYQATGSLLLASSAAEANDLLNRHASLRKLGMEVQFLDAGEDITPIVIVALPQKCISPVLVAASFLTCL